MQSADRDIPFQLIGGRTPLILLRGQVNEAGSFNLILDSGASHCLISHELAASLGISSATDEDAIGAGGHVRLSLATVDSVTVGATRQENIPFIITPDLEPIGAALKVTVQGAIGCNFLKDFCVTLDYHRKTVRFARASDADDGTSGSILFTPFNFGPSGPLILMQAYANGQGPLLFLLDTAAGRSVLSPTVANRLNVEMEKTVKARGIGGQIQMGRGRLDSLMVGRASVGNHLVMVGDFLDEVSKAVGAELDGVIGNDFLIQFHVTLDFPRKRVGLEPRTDSESHSR
jgi:predicted aspartyl protease